MKNDDTPAAEAATLTEALAAAFAEEFEEFAASNFVRKAVRASIAGKVKRRSLLQLGFAQGCKVGNKAATLVLATQLARALGLPIGTDWAELMHAVRDLASRETVVLRPFDIRDHLPDEDLEREAASS